ncbi:MAG: lysyl oxidase family protein [Chitinophagales bacterium]
MKKIYFSLLVLFAFSASAYAACGGGQKEVIITIVPDNYPLETSWTLRDAQTNALIDSGGVNSDTVCIGATQCVRFTIFDQVGDGICCAYGNGSYNVKLDGIVVASGGQFSNSEYTTFNCSPGFDCTNPLIAVKDTMTAPGPETWYVFTADSTGTYDIKTCNLGNTCDTKLYVYDHCSGLSINEGVQGTTYYDDDGCGSNFQSLITAALQAGSTYYIRVGDYLTYCAGHTINWEIRFHGPIAGCMDSTSCNYNPLATISDGSCVYAPSPLCPAPDLAVDQNELETSMYVDNINAGAVNCYVGEGCLAGYGNRRIIRFSTHIRNIGNEDYYIGPMDTVGSQFVYDACHQHWHYVGYAEYLLYDQNWNQMEAGYKNGFCVLDLECSGGGMAKYGCGNMGITSGCGDIYGSSLDCQWIDVTDIDTGTYTLVVRVNWDKSPDRLGHYEKTYDNNWAQVCLHLYYDNGFKMYEVLPNCAIYVDCAGDTLGNAQKDCNNVCNGSGVRGDLDINQMANSTDFNLYLDGLKNETLSYAPCTDLNGDSMMTVTDAARLNGCLLNNAGLHHHPGNYQNTHKHCDFPFNIYNPNDSVTFSIANVNWQDKYVDISVLNPSCQLLAYELKMHGLQVDSVKNLALGNYTPDIRTSTTGHIVGIAADENSLFKQSAALNFIRIYYRSLTDTAICIEKVIAAVNSNYEEVLGKVGGACAYEPVVEPSGIVSINSDALSVVPNPSNGLFDIYLSGQSLYGADIRITDALGRMVLSRKHENLSNHFAVDLGAEQSGFYYLHINLNGSSLTKRLLLIKQ